METRTFYLGRNKGNQKLTLFYTSQIIYNPIYHIHKCGILLKQCMHLSPISPPPPCHQSDKVRVNKIFLHVKTHGITYTCFNADNIYCKGATTFCVPFHDYPRYQSYPNLSSLCMGSFCQTCELTAMTSLPKTHEVNAKCGDFVHQFLCTFHCQSYRRDLDEMWYSNSLPKTVHRISQAMCWMTMV